jgi:integrase
MSAARNGEAFDIAKGLPVAMLRTVAPEAPWFKFACEYVDMKWPDASPGHRRNIATDLTSITLGLLVDARTGPDGAVLRRALRLAFNPKQRDGDHTSDIADALRWLGRHTRQVGMLSEPDVFRAVIAALDRNLDGQRAAPNTIRLRRATLTNALDYAVECELLTTNPMRVVKTRKNRTTLREIDKRAVPNPVQFRTLLNSVKEISPRLVAFFAVLYFAGLRPEEAANLRKQDLDIPEEGWGEIHLERAAPEVSGNWTDSGDRNEERALKHREIDEGRSVPSCPELTIILHEHLKVFGTAPDGRFFPGARGGGRLPSSVYGRVWALAREAVFTAEVFASLLAKRPYDLRHAAVSTWLSAAVEPPRVAKWAGHSLNVLLRVYAKFLDAGEEEARRRIQHRLGG